MKKTLLALTLIVLNVLAFSKKTSTTKPGSSGTINIDVPKFDNPAATRFYEAWAAHVKKAVTAIHNKDEAGWKNLKNDEKELNEKEKQAMKTKLTSGDMKRKQA